MLLALLYLHIDFLSLMLITVLGVLSGISIGLLISVIINKGEDAKLGLIIAISMAFSVLAGLTGVSLKYVIDSKLPFINKINPAAMMTDGLYAVYYGDSVRFTHNIVSLIIFIVLIVIISILCLRRKKYDSI